jgi:hypothetical protein
MYKQKERVTFNIMIKSPIKRKFIKHCQRHEFVPSRRIEKLMLKDMNNNFISEDFNGGAE